MTDSDRRLALMAGFLKHVRRVPLQWLLHSDRVQIAGQNVAEEPR